MAEWIKDPENDAVNILARMEDGYTMEEKKYIVRDKKDTILLYKDDKGKIERTNKGEFMQRDYTWALTEKEIKDYDERYWAFAEEVTE